jgi:hypothetical protein
VSDIRVIAYYYLEGNEYITIKKTQQYTHLKFLMPARYMSIKTFAQNPSHHEYYNYQIANLWRQMFDSCLDKRKMVIVHVILDEATHRNALTSAVF